VNSAIYTIQFKPAAERDLKRIKDRAVLRRIAGAIDGLAANPRPRNAKVLQGASSILRIRVGDYRILYTIEDAVLLVLVVRIGRRREVYRGRRKTR
jgi:mRNA interferase RelE/StbE